jgi:hypothetical protein
VSAFDVRRYFGRSKMFKFMAGREWSLVLLGLVVVLAGCKSGGAGGGGY